MTRFVVAAGIVAGLGFAALAAPAMAQTKPTIAIIVKDTTSVYWQTVLAGARKAGQDLGVDVTELGAQSEADVAGQIGILEKAVASNPAAIVIAPAQFTPLGKPIDEAAKKVKIIGIDSTADTKAWTSFLATDDVAGWPHGRRCSRQCDDQDLCRYRRRRSYHHRFTRRRLARSERHGF